MHRPVFWVLRVSLRGPQARGASLCPQGTSGNKGKHPWGAIRIPPHTAPDRRISYTDRYRAGEEGTHRGLSAVLGRAPGGEDTCFTVEGRVPPGLYRVYARGRRGELLLGVWEGGVLRRRFSRALTGPIGPVERGCVRSSRVEEWRPAPAERFPGWPAAGGLCRPSGEGWELALPFDGNGPFPIPALFCLARIATVAGRPCAVFRFDGTGWPVLPKNC